MLHVEQFLRLKFNVIINFTFKNKKKIDADSKNVK